MGKQFERMLKEEMQSAKEMLETAGNVRGPAFENMVGFGMLCNSIVQMFRSREDEGAGLHSEVLILTMSHLMHQYAAALKISDAELKDALEMAYTIGTRVYSRMDN